MRPRLLTCLRKLNWRNRVWALLLIFAMTAIASSAQTLTTLNSFDNTNGAYPFAGLVQATDGNFYGTTYNGGSANEGVVFKITPEGTLTTQYNFCSKTNCTAGALPYAGLIQDTNGILYGTTVSGVEDERGTAFKITLGGTLTTLYDFCSQSGCTDGSDPFAGLVQASNGNLYGVTVFGGKNSYGSIFELTLAGKLTTLYSFCPASGCTDGAEPYAALVQASNGKFYGTTQTGGANKNSACAVEGCGTVFEFSGSGAPTTLYSFCAKSGCADGQSPNGALIIGTDGNLYGTTLAGGNSSNDGTVFKITTTGKLTTLHSFCPETGCADGEVPFAGLVQATDGNLYGTTVSGGLGQGTIFKITTSGTLTTLYDFCQKTDCADGQGPNGGLIQGTNGDFYGTTFYGGAHGYGSVYSLSEGLGPFVITRPTSGKVGAAVTILGTDLTGATSVTFNGKAATFTVVSSSEITTKVPTGATTGEVEVKTPSGTLTSNVEFQVP